MDSGQQLGRIWRGILIAIMVVGVIFRLSYLGRKVYWHDKIFTTLRVTGHHGQAVQQQVFTGDLLSLGLLLTVGIVSCGTQIQARTWWNKGISYHNPAIADTIRQAKTPLIMGTKSSSALGNFISLSYLLPADAAIQLSETPQEPPADWPGSVFLYDPDPDLIEEIPPQAHAQ
jgi:uncharacterized membrane protein